MYEHDELNIKKSDISGEIPTLSDFNTDNTICYNSADGAVFEKVPIVAYDVKRTYYITPSPSVKITASTDFSTISPGQKVILTWSTQHAIKAYLNEQPISLSGQLELIPQNTTVYSLRAVNGDDIDTISINISVIPLPEVTVNITKSEIELGDTSIINWTSNFADTLTLNDGVSTVSIELSGSLSLSPSVTTTYTFNATNTTGNFTTSITLTVNTPESNWRTTDSTGDPDIVIPNNSVVYIDTTFTGQNLGTINNPYNNWTQVPKNANTTYLFKRNTTINIPTGIDFLNKVNVSLGAYGTGDRPKIVANSTTATSSFYLVRIRFYNSPTDQQSSYTRISGLDISATIPSKSNGVSGSSNLLIDNCYIHHTTWGWRSTSAAQGDPSRISNITMTDTVIESTQDDGIFIQNADNITIDKVLVIKSNQNYHTVGHLQTQAPGDGIQINAATKIRITNCKIDRSDTGCKFCLIISGFFDTADNYLLIDNNEFIAPITTNQGGAGIYISDIRTSMPIIFSNNKLKGDRGLTGVHYQSTGELKSINNVYDTLNTALSKLTSTGSVCTSNGDTFINCVTNTRGVTII